MRPTAPCRKANPNAARFHLYTQRQRHPESLSHALISCDLALSVWSLWQDCPIEKLLNVKDFNDLVLHFCSPLLDKHLDFFFAIAWSIWHNRNKIIHNESRLPPGLNWDFAKNIIEEFEKASTWDYTPLQPPLHSWAAPSLGFAKVNVDGACSIDGSGISGVGVIIRDESGGVITALSKALPSHFPAEWTEFIALEQGILLAQELNLTHVIFKSDASSVISAISQGKTGGSMGHFVHSIRAANSYFFYCLFQHVKRDYNRAAYELAQVAKCNQVSNLWKCVIPPF
uniref:RNase H type-1 domain-containing protein n=1 Tax=Quercus lobata TaxID=97700 RepID=A0A7N2MZD8_QUELO